MDAPITSILAQTLGEHIDETLTPEVAARIVMTVLRRVYPGPVDISGIAPLTVGRYVLAPLRFCEVLPDLKLLHQRHWDETETHRNELVRLNPDYERVCEVERQGRFLLVGAIERDTSALVGNVGMYLGRSVHTQELVATEDTLYLLPEHRGGRLGVALMRYAEAALRHLGVAEFTVDVKLVNEVGEMIQRMGYEPVGKKYVKNLRGEASVLA